MSDKEEILKKEFGKLLSDDYCYLSHSFRIDGNLYSPGSVMLKGFIDGDLRSEGNVFIEDGAEVNGNVSGKNIVIYGKVTGIITAQEKLGLYNTAKVTGDIKARKCVIESNVTIAGRIEISENLTPDIEFDYPVITARKPRSRTSGFDKYQQKLKEREAKESDLVLPLYPAEKSEVKEKSETLVIEDKLNGNGADNNSDNKSAPDKDKIVTDQGDSKDKSSKSRIDLLDSDHSLW